MMKMITMIMILLLIILNYNYSYILKLNRIINNNSNTKKYLLIKPNINDNHDEVVNIYNDYVLKDKSKAIHKVIDVPKLEDITKSIKKTKRTPQSKDFCIRSGGYPNNDIKYDMYIINACVLLKLLESLLGLKVFARALFFLNSIIRSPSCVFGNTI